MNTHGKKIEVFAQFETWQRAVQFWIRETTWSPNHTTIAVAEPLMFRALGDEDLGQIQQPAFHLHAEQAQQFMDELWRIGIRPTEGTGSAGSLAATERHLADMRALVFKREPKKLHLPE